MYGLFPLTLAITAFTTRSLAGPAIAQPGTEANLLITAQNILYDTHPGVPLAATTINSGLKVVLHNNLGPSATVNAYIVGRDPNGAVVLLKSDGTWYRPNPHSTGPVVIPPSSGTKLAMNPHGETAFILPSATTAGRIYIAEGELAFHALRDGAVVGLVEPSFATSRDPNAGIRWGFVEFTAGKGALTANLSFVDFIGLLLSIGVTFGDGRTEYVRGLRAYAMEEICAGLINQAAVDGQPWDAMCVLDERGKVVRILSPNIFVNQNPTSMVNYYTEYIEQVWTKYTRHDLTIRTGAFGDTTCRVHNHLLHCAGSAAPFAKPRIEDIWGCNTGTFAPVPSSPVHEALRAVLCAAFDRSTLLLPGGEVQPALDAARYYTVSPTNHYARLVHRFETDGRGYAFSFDDVNPPGGVDQSGTLSGVDARRLEVFVGGMNVTAPAPAGAAAMRRRGRGGLFQ